MPFGFPSSGGASSIGTTTGIGRTSGMLSPRAFRSSSTAAFAFVPRRRVCDVVRPSGSGTKSSGSRSISSGWAGIGGAGMAWGRRPGRVHLPPSEVDTPQGRARGLDGGARFA